MSRDKYTKCDGCPCLNIDNEAGAWCNLGYPTDSYWFDKQGNKFEDTPEMRSHQEDFDLFNASEDCGLIEVRHRNGVYRPIEFKRKEQGR